VAPPDYGLTYPQALIESLSRHVIGGCAALGLRSFNEVGNPVEPPGPENIPGLLEAAWRTLRSDPVNYEAWEQAQLEALWRSLSPLINSSTSLLRAHSDEMAHSFRE